VEVTPAAPAATLKTRHTHTARTRNRQTDIQTDKQTGRQAGRQAGRQRWTETVQPRDPSPFHVWQQEQPN